MPRQRLLPGEPVWSLLETPRAREALAALTESEREALVTLDTTLNPFGRWRFLGSPRAWGLLVAVVALAAFSWGPLAGVLVLAAATLYLLGALALTALRPGPTVEEAEEELAAWLARTRLPKAGGWGAADFRAAPTPGRGDGDNGGEEAL